MNYPTSEADIVVTSGISLTAEYAGAPRGISSFVADKYGFHVGHHRGEKVLVCSYKDANGEAIGLKARTEDKRFFWEDRGKPGFFGQHLAGSVKELVITEGEIDAMSIATACGMAFRVAVSVPDGAATAAQVVKDQIDWLRKFETIYLAFDRDEPGLKATAEVVKLLPPGKVRIVEWERKDANEVLLKDGQEKVKWSIGHARYYAPDGLVSGDALRDKITQKREPGLPYPFPFLNEAVLGQREGEITVWLAGSGVGKSTFLGSVAHDLLVRQDQVKIGTIFLEDSLQEAMLRVLSFERKENLLMLDTIPDEVLEDYDRLIKDRVVAYDPETGWSADRIVEAIRWMAVGEECDVIFLDHLSAVVGVGGSDKQVQQTEDLMYQLRRVAITTRAHIHVVSHLRKTGSGNATAEEGGEVTMQDAKGSGAIFQVANTMLGLKRNTQADSAEERDVTSVVVLKGRLTGLTGETGKLLFNRETYRLEETNRDARPTTFNPVDDGSPSDSETPSGDRIPFEPDGDR